MGMDVLEVGSRMHDESAWWVNNRDLGKGNWTGIDMQAGLNVDIVMSLYDMPKEWNDRFTSVVCCEVLEHVDYPWLALPQIYRVMQPGAILIITVPWCFPKHLFPNDFYRYSPDGLKALLEFSQFTEIQVEASIPLVQFDLNGYGEPPNFVGIEPTHSYAIARKPL
jgi:SAM-dependent methyltransferase